MRPLQEGLRRTSHIKQQHMPLGQGSQQVGGIPVLASLQVVWECQVFIVLGGMSPGMLSL